MKSHIITRQAALDELCRKLAQSDWLAVDTEFLRVKTYYPQLCLIQVASEVDAVCVDPVSDLDLTPLLSLLTAARPVKVIHSARQDLEVLYLLMNEVPQPVFDTQLAAALLGYGAQVGYATLVEELLGTVLAKTETRTDWCARPLTDDQIEYALDDVRYLGALYLRMRAELASRGRDGWAQLEFATLADPTLYATDPQQAYKKLGRGHILPARGQHVLKALARWREHTAQRENRPRNWIADNKTLFSLAQNLPTDVPGLAGIADIEARFVRRHGREVLVEIEQALAAADQQAIWSKPIRLDAAHRKLCDSLMEVLREVAERERIAPSMLGSRREIEQLVRGQLDLPLLRGWRGELLGHRLQQELTGQRGTDSSKTVSS